MWTLKSFEFRSDVSGGVRLRGVEAFSGRSSLSGQT
jgi:hypothetical protein